MPVCTGVYHVVSLVAIMHQISYQLIEYLNTSKSNENNKDLLDFINVRNEKSTFDRATYFMGLSC